MADTDPRRGRPMGAAPVPRPSGGAASRLPSLGRRGEGWVAIQALLLAVILLAGPVGPAVQLGTAAGLAGLVLIVPGVVLALRGIVDLRENLTALPRPRPGATLVTSGAYRLVRHPIYAGILVASFGWSVAWVSSSALVVTLVLGVFFVLKARREEAWLRAEVEGYAEYCGRTRRLIPWVY